MAAKKDTRQLIKKLENQGFEVTLRNGHYRVFKDGTFTVVMPSTPSDSRGLKNAMAYLKRAGFQR
ncbi:type II toxin-antitoxin system HicA family toxin [Streptacidiphilus sp. EB103A]|uniref:type II toxin-antitoxin system HicA family toxin n=1 Tax=Streptacidiphilus sp. EB103A TaxID=3156275 RepID=UPI003512694D